jgi:hypothetical protein
MDGFARFLRPVGFPWITYGHQHYRDLGRSEVEGFETAAASKPIIGVETKP